MTQATETVGNYTVTTDDDGTKFVELGHQVVAWEAYLGLLKQRAEIDAAIDRARSFFERHMTDAKVDGMMINGRKVVTYKQDATFPAAKFAKENPGIAAAFMTTREVLDVAALRQHRPQDYDNWRGRTFKIVRTGA